MCPMELCTCKQARLAGIDERLAQEMAGGGALGALLGKALAARDPLALRIVRNLAERCSPGDAAAAFAPAAEELLRLITARFLPVV